MAKKNPGKVFEEDFKKSINPKHLAHRLRDSAQSFKRSKDTSFAWDNECDFFIHDVDNRILWCVECKSTKYKSMSIQIDENDNKNSMIKRHQIDSLTDFATHMYTIPCFIMNFRDEDTNNQRTYYMHIDDFNKFLMSTTKKSINEIDIIMNGGIKIDGNKKRIRYSWDIDYLMNQVAIYKGWKLN